MNISVFLVISDIVVVYMDIYSNRHIVMKVIFSPMIGYSETS